MDTWVSRNNPRLQTAVAAGCSAAGVWLVVAARDGVTWAWSDATAGFLLGVLLLVCGVAAFLSGGRESVTVDPHSRSITVEDAGGFSGRKRRIAFDEVEDIGIGYLGRASNFVRFYYLLLRLKSGEDYALFAPGRFYPGASDRTIVEGWRLRLQGMIDGDAPQSSASSR